MTRIFFCYTQYMKFIHKVHSQILPQNVRLPEPSHQSWGTQTQEMITHKSLHQTWLRQPFLWPNKRCKWCSHRDQKSIILHLFTNLPHKDICPLFRVCVRLVGYSLFCASPTPTNARVIPTKRWWQAHSLLLTTLQAYAKHLFLYITSGTSLLSGP